MPRLCPFPMPAIDLARLRKQASRLADFYFLPDEFMKHLREILDFYVNYTLRTKENVAPGSNLKTYRTPAAVITQIENELREKAESTPVFTLDLVDLLWGEESLETRLLASYLLGCIPPEEKDLIPRITTWLVQTRDPQIRSEILSTSLARMRRETPQQFLHLIEELLHPNRTVSWSNGIQALLPVIAETSYTNLPVLFDMVEPVIINAPPALQTDITELIIALYRASPSETVFVLKQILADPENAIPAITLRRISRDFPPSLQREIRDALQPKSAAAPVQEEEIIDDFVVEPILPATPELTQPVKTEKRRAPRKPKMDNSRIIYLHGLESTSQSGKARQFAEKFPGMVTPDFSGSFEERMKQLKPILGRKRNWTIIGSSYGGLMGAMFTLMHPSQVRKLILLAPALMLEPFASTPLEAVSVPTIVVHGTQDDIVPLEPVRKLAERSFKFITYYVVEDGHRLQNAFNELNWEDILA